MTQTPSVVQAIAKGLGVTTAELKAMVDSGEIDSALGISQAVISNEKSAKYRVFKLNMNK